MLALVTAGTIILPEIFIRTTLSIASNVISSIHYLKSISQHDQQISNLIDFNDIIEDINIIKNFIQEKSLNNISQTIQTCFKNITSTMTELEKHIKSITNKIENHKHLWFHSFRSYNIEEEKIQIPFLVRQLKHRFDLLIQVSLSLKN